MRVPFPLPRRVLHGLGLYGLVLYRALGVATLMSRTSHVLYVSAAVAVLGLAATISTPMAQQAGGKAAPAWVKLCEKTAYLEPDPKDAKKPIQKERSICHTHHERLDAQSGTVMISAAIREIEGADKKVLMIMLPLGMSIQPGVQIGLYPPDMWASIQKGDTVDDSKIEPLKMMFTLCHVAGCSAELDATPEVIKRLQGSGGLIAFAVNGGGAPTAFPAPLNGFSEALAGPAIDNKVYYDERKKLMEQLSERRKAAVEDFRKQNQDLQAIAPKPQAPTAAPAPTAAAPAPAAGAPAAKKP
jgi:invasion protein IalB